jgi:DNA-binding PadR family transcriptional regulator
MPADPLPRSSPVAMTVLFMLMADPIHPYEMQRRMKLWGKDRVVNVAQRANLYKTIDRLLEAGLIAVLHTERDQRFPERTVYQATELGLHTAREWLIDMLSCPRNEFPRFPAALSFIFALMPSQACEVLETRAEAMRKDLASLEDDLAGNGGPLPPRVTLLETEYLRKVTQAEVEWLDEIIADLRSGVLSWSQAELVEAAQNFLNN